MTEWTQRKVSDLIDGLRAGVSVRSSPGVNGGPAVLKTSAIKSGRFDPSEVKTILKADLQRAKCPVAADSLIISRMNTPALVGDIGYVDEDRADLYLPDRLWLAQKKRNSDTDMRWLTYHFSSGTGARALRDLATGTSGSMKNIPKNKVLNLVILTPSALEQQAIADAITNTDDLIESLERLIAKKQAIKQGMMQELLTGRARLPAFSREWEVARLAEVSTLKGRIGWQGLTQEEFTDHSSDPFLITGMNFKDGAIRWDEVYHVSEERYDIAPEIQLRPGDVLMTKDGTIGKLLFVDHIPHPGKASLNSHLLLFRPKHNSYEPMFLYYQLGTPRFKAHIEENKSGSTFFGISQSSVGNYEMLLPELEEQRAISRVLYDADKEIDVLERRLESARNIKQGMMQELLTGRTRLPVEEVSS